MAGVNGPTKLLDIAKLVDCSVATVSNAINGRGRMSDEMRRRILRQCGELNFVPNSAGRSLRLQRTDAVGVIYAPSFAELFGNVFYARIMEGLAETFGEAGLDLMLGNRMDPDGVPAIVRQGKVDALVVLAGRVRAGDLREPPQLPGAALPGGWSSRLAGGGHPDQRRLRRRAAGRRVPRRQGPSRGAYDRLRNPLYNIEQRIAGFLFGLRSAGIKAREDDVIIRVDENEQAAEELKRQLSGKNPPTAVFVVNDTFAVYLIGALTEAGYRVPQDISVVGFDDDPVAAACQPPLTTVALGKRDFGAESARMVLNRLAHPESPPIHQVQPTRLVVRDSVGER